MKELTPLLLLLAFSAVGLSAWLLGRREGRVRRVRMPRDFFVGLDHLVNDRFDRATEVFARMAQTDGDSAEIQFALGSLFRRRGEVDRAIRIHTRLREQNRGPMADQATYALALDYLSAGLMDRAEQLFHEVAARGGHRPAALDQLLRVHEQQRDWANALRVFHELPLPVQSERNRIAAHYLCELAELALLQADGARVRTLLAQALARAPQFPRARQLEGRLAELESRPAEATERYLQVVAAAPQLVLEVAPRALSLVAGEGRSELLDRIARGLVGGGETESAGLIWALAAAVSRTELACATGLMTLLRERLSASAQRDDASRDSVLAFVGFAHAAQEAAGRYQCRECGFRSVTWYWQCPGCRSWDSQHPLAFPWSDAASRAFAADSVIAPAPAGRSERLDELRVRP